MQHNSISEWWTWEQNGSLMLWLYGKATSGGNRKKQGGGRKREILSLVFAETAPIIEDVTIAKLQKEAVDWATTGGRDHLLGHVRRLIWEAYEKHEDIRLPPRAFAFILAYCSYYNTQDFYNSAYDGFLHLACSALFESSDTRNMGNELRKRITPDEADELIGSLPNALIELNAKAKRHFGGYYE